MIVGMHRAFSAARAGQDLVGPRRDDLVRVHVCLGARAGLPNDEGKLLVQLTLGDLLGGLGDRFTELLGQQA